MGELPAAVERHRAAMVPGAALLDLPPLALTVDGRAWTLAWTGAAVQVAAGAAPGARAVALTAEQLADLVHDQTTPVGLYVSGALGLPRGAVGAVLDWWLVMRAALDARALPTAGGVSLRDRHGEPLDLGTSFAPDADREEMRHFLHEAGFLHLRGVFTDREMARIDADMDRAAAAYGDGDGKSWWVTVGDGSRRLARMQGFDQHSEAAAALLADDRLRRLGDLTGDGHRHTGLPGNRIEALVKPIGVVQGISDVPWHKDCSLGRHSYECCSLTVGISVTGAGARSGQLRVTAGSHRTLIWPALLQSAERWGLREVDLPTKRGDVTVHLSCTLHMSQPPVERERRVMYTSFRLPAADETAAAAAAARSQLLALREAAPVTVSQEAAASRTSG